MVALFAFLLPKIFRDQKKISYTVYEIEELLEQEEIEQVEVKINEELVNSLFLHKVRIWNSGTIPLKDLQILIRLDNNNRGFKIFSVQHSTIPEYEFGLINDEIVDNNSRRVKYSLLNPNDEDLIALLANQKAYINLYAKSENLKVKFHKQDKLWHSEITIFVAGLIAALGSIIYSLIRKLSTKKVDDIDFFERMRGYFK